MNGKQFATVLVITFIAGAVWLISDIIFNTKASIPVSPELESSLKPINPSFNSRVLELIKEVPDQDDLNISNPEPVPSASPLSVSPGTPSPLIPGPGATSSASSQLQR